MTRQQQEQILLELDAIVAEKKRLKPLPGPQTKAFECLADELFYGGSAGSGKSFLLLLLAMDSHRKSIIFRREYPQLKGLEEESHRLFATKGHYNSTTKIWRLNDGRIVEFGAVQLEKDKEKFQGRDHDLVCYDEITHFSKSQYQFLIGWNRSSYEGQRSRVVCTGNPPTSSEGDWVIDYWGAWLDERHPNPAQPGELRWYTNLDGKTIEVENGESFLHKGMKIIPRSRTFIPGTIHDNPYLLNSGYLSTLQSLPKELREKFLEGKFSSSREDDAWQVIPSTWVQLAMQRWRERQRPNVPCSCIGVDVARGGRDQTVLTKRHLNWFDQQLVYPGSETPDGPMVAGLVLAQIERNTKINVDIIGVGSSVYDSLKVHHPFVYPINSAMASDETTKESDILGFFNKRAEMWWRLRESLNPENGDDLAIPDDRELFSDLTAPRWEHTVRGIKIELKEKTKDRIGRSPDKGDSMVYAHALMSDELAFGSF